MGLGRVKDGSSWLEGGVKRGCAHELMCVWNWVKCGSGLFGKGMGRVLVWAAWAVWNWIDIYILGIMYICIELLTFRFLIKYPL